MHLKSIHLILTATLILPLIGCDNAAEKEAARQAAERAARYQQGAAAREKGDYAAAAQSLAPLAEQGHSGAQLALGDMSLRGEGRDNSPGEAFEWYRKAAEQGNAEAQAKLSQMYAYGWGVERNLALAAEWQERARANGYGAETERPPEGEAPPPPADEKR